MKKLVNISFYILNFKFYILHFALRLRSVLAFFILYFTFYNSAFVQQLPLYSQYILNDFVLNPAIAGKHNYNLIQSNVKYQWVGINEAPRTFVLSANIPYNPQKVGLGGYLFTDIAGPVTVTGLNLAYAYHIDMGEELKLSMGVFGGMLQYKINGPEIILADEEERYLFDKVETAVVPDASFGIYTYTDRFFLGVSFNHLFHNKIKKDIFNKSSEGFGYLSNHMFITAGYRIEINEDFELEPSLLFKIVSPLPTQMDMSARVFYKEQVWIGFAYRTQDAINIMIGYEFKERVHVGYSYDFTTSNLKNYSSGSNEIMLGYKFGSKTTKSKKNAAPLME